MMAHFEFLGRFARNRGALIGAGLILLTFLTSGFRVKLDDLVPEQAFAEEN